MSNHKTIAEFHRENGPVIPARAPGFMVLFRQLGLLGSALVAIDGSKFKAVKARHKNFTAYKFKQRNEQVVEHISGYFSRICTLQIAIRAKPRGAFRWAGEKIDQPHAQMAMLKVMGLRLSICANLRVSSD